MITLRDWPRSDTFENYLRLLRPARDEIGNVRACASPDDLRTQFIRVVDQHAHSLRWAMPRAELERIFYTGNYAAVTTAAVPASQLTPMVHASIAHAQDALDELIQAVEHQETYWRNAEGHLVLPDTNYFIGEHRTYEELDFCTTFGLAPGSMTLVVPIAVVDELDNLKRRNANKTDRPARAALKFIEKVAGQATDGAPYVLHAPSAQRIGKINVAVVMDDPTHQRLSIADDEIVDRARTLGQCLGRPVIVSVQTERPVRICRHRA